jgi:hypothetical protein
VSTVDLAALCLAGADLPAEVTRLRAAITAERWAERSLVDNDCFALLRAGTAMPDAIAVVCGAGTNCVGRSADCRVARFSALGAISGDWGGGHDLAEYALRYAARGEDGRGGRTALTAAVARHFGRPTVESVSIALHVGELPMSAVHDLAPLVFEVAAAGDPVARIWCGARPRDPGTAPGGRRPARSAAVAARAGPGRRRAAGAPSQLHEQVVAGARAQAPQVTISVVTARPWSVPRCWRWTRWAPQPAPSRRCAPPWTAHPPH